MTTIPRSLLIALCLSLLTTATVSAQICPFTAQDVVAPYAPGTTVFFLRATPDEFSFAGYCSLFNGEPAPMECLIDTTSPLPTPAGTIGTDSASNLYYGTQYQDGNCPNLNGCSNTIARTAIDGTTQVVAFLSTSVGSSSCGWQFYYPQRLALDVTNGTLLVPFRAALTFNGNPATTAVLGIVELTGLPKLFDTLLTFIPGQAAMNILTPAMPDGFRSADSLQVWTGNVRSMPDWSKAQPLACMAAQNPTPGQLVSIADTLPDPAIGEGRYYLVASQNGADRRLGRQYVNGAFSARQPAGLPVCQ